MKGSARRAGVAPRQGRFAEEYLVDLNGAGAAIRAGYSRRAARFQAARLLTNVNVQELIEGGRARQSERTELTQDWVISRLRMVAERCMEAEEILDREGRPTGVFRFDAAGATRALELLGKHQGMFSDRNLNVKLDPNANASVSIYRGTDPIEAADAYRRMIEGVE